MKVARSFNGRWTSFFATAYSIELEFFDEYLFRRLGEPPLSATILADARGHAAKTVAAKRDVPIPPSLARLLADHREKAFAKGFAKPSDFVFASATGGPLNHRNVSRRGLDKALERATLPKLRWHDLRHIAASALIAEGASLPYLSRVLGHASPAITLQIYAHEFARAEHAEHTRQRMEKAFASLLG